MQFLTHHFLLKTWYNWGVGALESETHPNTIFELMNHDAFDSGVLYFVVIAIAIIESIQVLLSIPTKGIFINPRISLEKKTVKELKAMLVGVKRLSSKNKSQLVELVLEY